MKIEVVQGTVTQDGKDYGAGKTLDIDNAAAERLIKLGYAKEAGGNEDKEEKARQEAAAKRNALEAKAQELKIGTPEEIGALSDADIAERIKKAGGNEGLSFIGKLFGGGKSGKDFPPE